MREIGFAIIAALAMTTAAQSQALDDGSFWQHRPSRAILEKYWPHDAEGRTEEGLPVEGARVRLQIRKTSGDAAPPAPATKP